MGGITNTYGASYGAGYNTYNTNRQKTDTAPANEVNEWMDAIAKRKEEILEKVRKGETEPSIPIGAASFTYKQWNKLMKNVDRAIEDMQERIQAEEEEAKLLIKKKKENSITMEMLEELLGIEVKDASVINGGELSSQISSGERVAMENDYYCIQPEENGIFRISDKTTGLEYKFAEEGCSLRQDRASGRIFLMPSGDYEQTGSVMVADGTLLSVLSQYFQTDSLQPAVLIGYSFERNPETGIEIMIPDHMKGKTAYMLFQSQADIEAYNRLAQTYKNKYPNLVQSDEMANFYAALEIEGLCHRTETGILYTNASGVSYADENDPSKSWWLAFDIQSDKNYDMLMEMLDNIKANGKEISDFYEWKAGWDRMS